MVYKEHDIVQSEFADGMFLCHRCKEECKEQCREITVVVYKDISKDVRFEELEVPICDRCEEAAVESESSVDSRGDDLRRRLCERHHQAWERRKDREIDDYRYDRYVARGNGDLTDGSTDESDG
jgi:hypothetical protein